MVYSPAFILSSVYSLGFWFLAGLRLLVLCQFSAFLQAVSRLGGAVLFRGLRPSSIQWFLFWRLGLTVQSSRPAFGGRLTFGIRMKMKVYEFCFAKNSTIENNILKTSELLCDHIKYAAKRSGAKVDSITISGSTKTMKVRCTSNEIQTLFMLSCDLTSCINS